MGPFRRGHADLARGRGIRQRGMAGRVRPGRQGPQQRMGSRLAGGQGMHNPPEHSARAARTLPEAACAQAENAAPSNLPKVQLLDGSAIRRARTERGWTQQRPCPPPGDCPSLSSPDGKRQAVAKQGVGRQARYGWRKHSNANKTHSPGTRYQDLCSARLSIMDFKIKPPEPASKTSGTCEQNLRNLRGFLRKAS